MPWLWYILLIVVQFLGILLTIMGLPGIWVMIAALVGFAWVTTFDLYAGWPSIITVLALGIIAEIIEFIMGAAGAKKAGASSRAMIGALIGGLIGGIACTIPIPVVGTIFGVCLGCFIGASVVEMGIVGNAKHATRVGLGAAKGKLYGILLKLVFAAVIFVVAVIAGFPVA